MSIVQAFKEFAVKGVNKMHRQAEAVPEAPSTPPTPSEEVLLLREISAKLDKRT